MTNETLIKIEKIRIDLQEAKQSTPAIVSINPAFKNLMNISESLLEVLTDQATDMQIITDTVNGIITFMDTVTKAELVEMGQTSIKKLLEQNQNMGGGH